MKRDRRNPTEDHGWPDEGDADRPGRSGRVPSWTGGGLILVALVATGLFLMVREPEKPKTQGQFHRAPSPLGSVAFAPDGRTLALGRSDGGLEIQSLVGGRDREIESGPGLGVLDRGLAYSPDGRTLASGGQGFQVKLWDATSGALKDSFWGHRAAVGALAFSPDGRTLASGARDGSIKLWDLETGGELASIAGHSLDIRGLAFSPDGKSLASGSLDGSARIWDVATWLERLSFRDGGRRVYGLSFAPDGRTLALGLGARANGSTGEVVLWTPGAVRQPYRILGAASFAAVAFSPDGRTLAAGGGDRVVKLWDVATGQELANLAGHEGTIASVAFSPDGQALATAGLDSLVGLFELDPIKLKPAEPRLF